MRKIDIRCSIDGICPLLSLPECLTALTPAGNVLKKLKPFIIFGGHVTKLKPIGIWLNICWAKLLGII